MPNSSASRPRGIYKYSVNHPALLAIILICAGKWKKLQAPGLVKPQGCFFIKKVSSSEAGSSCFTRKCGAS